MYNVIYTIDPFQILQVYKGNLGTGLWDWAQDVYHNDLGGCVDRYDVETFDTLSELNQFIIDELEYEHTEKVPDIY